MERTTFMAREKTLEKLRKLAQTRRVSFAAVVREALEDKAEEYAPRPTSLGMGQADACDAARSAGSERQPPRSWLILDTGPLYASLDRSRAGCSSSPPRTTD